MIQPRNIARGLRRKPAPRCRSGIVDDGCKSRRIGHESTPTTLSSTVDEQYRPIWQQDPIAHGLRPVWQRIRRLPRRIRIVGIDGVAIGESDGVGNVARRAATDEDSGSVVWGYQGQHDRGCGARKGAGLQGRVGKGLEEGVGRVVPDDRLVASHGKDLVGSTGIRQEVDLGGLACLVLFGRARKKSGKAVGRCLRIG